MSSLLLLYPRLSLSKRKASFWHWHNVSGGFLHSTFLWVCICPPEEEGNGLQLSLTHYCSLLLTYSLSLLNSLAIFFFRIELLYYSRTLLSLGLCVYFFLLLILCCGVLFCRSFISNFPFVRNGRTLLKFFFRFIIIITTKNIYISYIFTPKFTFYYLCCCFLNR